MIVIYFFEIPIVAIVMLLMLVCRIEPGLICRYAGSMWAVCGVFVALWVLIGGEPWSSKEEPNRGFRIFLIILMVLMFVIPGWEVYKVGVGMGDKMLIDLLLGR